MLKVSQLVKFIFDLKPQNTPARLAFFNFLNGFADPNANLDADLINRFFSYSLDYPHWADNKSQLSHEVQFILQNFNSLFQHKFDTSGVKFPQSSQIIEIDNFSDLSEVVNAYLKTTIGAQDKVRLISDQNKRLLAVILKEDKSIEVRTFDRKFTLRNGLLEPLRKDLHLTYTPQLELQEGVTQTVEVAPYIVAQFKLEKGRVHGQVIRGYVFQKFIELKGELLTEQPRLFFPLKRLEQFFIDRRTDSYYQELVRLLERTTKMVQDEDPQGLTYASAALTRAETALENVFIGDKLLTLLIRDLRHATQAFKALSVPSQIGQGRLSPLQDNMFEDHEECLKISPIQRFDSIN